jgi:hypothetical protein
MGLISNGTTIFDAGAMQAGGGSMVFIKKITASSSSTISFVDGASSVVLDSTYKEYLFTFNNLHPQTDTIQLHINYSIDGGSNYNAEKTSTFFLSRHAEDNSSQELSYKTGQDLENSASNQQLTVDMDNDNDSGMSGFLRLYDPSNTTFIKHWTSRIQGCQTNAHSMEHYTAGYVNTTSAVDAVQFTASSGNLDSGDICLYGIN